MRAFSMFFCMHFYVLHSMRAFHSSFLKEMETLRIPLLVTHKDGEMQCCSKCSGSNSFKNKRHGPIRNPFDKMAPDFKTSWRDLYDEICSISTSSIPTTTRSDRTSNASCRFSHFGIHVPLNFYNFNPNFSLPVLLKV